MAEFKINIEKMMQGFIDTAKREGMFVSRWIPVSERLPEEDGDYLLWGKVTDADEECYCFIGEYDSCAEQFGIWQEHFDGTTLGCLGSDFYEYEQVLAWMPLPEPYKEVDNG